MTAEKEKINWLRLIRSENIGPRTFHGLISLFGSATKALDNVGEMSVKGGRKTPIKLCSESSAVKELESCQKIGANILTSYENKYPYLLKQIKDFPPVITIFGNPDLFNKNIIGMVGARNASANGCKFAEEIARSLGKKGIVISSGLARGIDTAAHFGSLDTGTIAVVAGGIDKVYPPENAELLKKIIEKGAVIAEMPLGAIPKAQNFPRRNRIISGISLGTLVVEASLNSGSLITARMALEQDREVFAVPGSPYDPRCRGTNDLIKQGAHLVQSSDDVIAEIGNAIKDRNEASLFETKEYGFKVATGDVSRDKIDSAREAVIEKIGCSPTQIDDIVTQTGFPVHVVLTILLELELAGRLSRHSGNKVSIIYQNEDMFA